MTITPLCTPPEPSEIKARRTRAQAAMARAGLEALVIFNPDNVVYLTNFANMVHERPFILVLPAQGTPVFVMPRLEEPHVRIRSVGALEFAPYFEFPAPEGQGWDAKLAEVLGGAQRIGIESDCPHYLVAALNGRHVVTEIVEDLRAIKSPWDINRHQYACTMMMLGMETVLEQSRPGALAMSVYSAASGRMTRQMYTDLPSSNLFSTRLQAGAQPQSISHDPHNFTDLFIPFTEGGPHVALSAGTANGYGGEVERTFFLGHVPEPARRPFDVMMQARALAYELAVPGAIMHDVDAAVNALLRKAGYGEALLHRTGHGMGVTGHEGPFLAEGDHREIRPGMVFTIEPGIYLPGLGGFRHSDTVLITETGNLNMTPWPETLDALTLPL
ncbi:MAG: Xaa-Pro peptidase family protein [Paracoccaceae bacterium]